MPDNNYSPIPDRPAEFGNGLTTPYRGFTISDTFTIHRDDKVINFPRCWTLDACKRMIDASIECKGRQGVNMGAALVSLGVCQSDGERFTEQVMAHAEEKLWEGER